MLHGTPSTSIKRSPSTRHYPIGPDCLLSPFSVRYSHYRRVREGERAEKNGRKEERNAGEGNTKQEVQGFKQKWRISGGGRKGAARENVKRREMRCMPNVANSCRVVTRVLRGEQGDEGKETRSVRDLISGTC